MASKRKRSASVVVLDQLETSSQYSPPRSTTQSPRAQQLAHTRDTAMIRNRLSGIQLDGGAENRQSDPEINAIDLTESEAEAAEAEAHAQQDLDDYLTDDEFAHWLAEANLQENPAAAPFRSKARDMIRINSFTLNNMNIRPGKTVELRDDDFMRVKEIFQGDGDRVLLSGWQFRRCSDLVGLLPDHNNELAMIVNLSIPAFARGERLKETTIEVTEVRRIRGLVLTNLPYTECNITNFTKSRHSSKRDARSPKPLFCRWKYVQVDDGQGPRAKNGRERIVSLIRRSEADQGYRANEAMLREVWRGKTHPGGSFEHVIRPPRRSGASSSDAIELEQDDQGQPLKKERRYAFGDAFCGCGGVSHGVSRVPGKHIKIKWGVDLDKHAIDSYAMNFRGTSCHYSPVDLFLYEDEGEVRVDILHASPPCQPFSPAHTVNSQVRDEANQAALLSLHELINRCRPRVVTVEETPGLIERHGEYFNALINVFTSSGYSVQWRILNFISLGVCQIRRRLIIIATGPGEDEIPFPAPTHGPGLLPFVTIGDSMRAIQADAPNHSPVTDFPEGSSWPKIPYDGDTKFARTLTCAADGGYHPSGRPYTHREMAAIQSFGPHFKFSRHYIRRQIGNAWSPLVVTKVYQEIVSVLRKSDGLEVRTG